MNVQINVVSDTLTPALNRLKQGLADPSAAMRTIAHVLDRSVKDNFRAQGRPRKWDALEPSTRNSVKTKDGKRRGSGHILRDTGTLMKNVQTKSGRYFAEIGMAGGTIAKIAGAHQWGASFTRPAIYAKKAKALRWFGSGGKAVFAKSVGPAHITIKKRTFIGRSDSPQTSKFDLLREDEDNIVKAIDAHVIRGQAGA